MSGEYVEYNFPAVRFVGENSPVEQLRHIISEACEVIDEVVENHDTQEQAVADEKVLCELADLSHSLETFWRIQEKLHGTKHVAGIFARVEEKNRKRGYYNK